MSAYVWLMVYPYMIKILSWSQQFTLVWNLSPRQQLLPPLTLAWRRSHKCLHSWEFKRSILSSQLFPQTFVPSAQDFPEPDQCCWSLLLHPEAQASCRSETGPKWCRLTCSCPNSSPAGPRHNSPAGLKNLAVSDIVGTGTGLSAFLCTTLRSRKWTQGSNRCMY